MSDEQANKSEQDLAEEVEVIEGEIVADSLEQTEESEETADEAPSLEEQLLAAQEEAAKQLDGNLRAQAELANARKRFERQRAQTYVNANADLVRRMLPVLDDYERALDTVPQDISADPWYEGIELVHRKLLSVLDSLNVKEIEAVGQPFDPNVHEALGQEPSDEYESGNVARVMQKGYQIGDFVVRPSLVFVAE